jgi:protein-tyrosine-phosphatase
MGEALLRQLLADASGEHEVVSAGVSASPGAAPSARAVEACAERGLDVSAHVAARLTAQAIEAADVVLCMERAHAHAVVALAPHDDVVPLGSLAEDARAVDVADPWGRDLEAYRETRERIAGLLDRLAAERGLVPYQPYWCEENVWQLLADERPGRASAVFISNPTRSVALWGQRAALVDGTPVVWDYHVVVLVEGDGPSEIHDLDCTASRRLPAARWIEVSFPVVDALPPELQPRFRVVEGARYREQLASDRSHMRGEDGSFRSRPPPWPPIDAGGTQSNLARFIDTLESWEGEVYDLDGFRRRVASRETR